MSATNFQAGYTILPPILSAQNSLEKLDGDIIVEDINGRNLDINSNSLDRNGNTVDLNGNSMYTSESTQTTVDGLTGSHGSPRKQNGLPSAPFSSILQQSLQFEYR